MNVIYIYSIYYIHILSNSKLLCYIVYIFLLSLQSLCMFNIYINNIYIYIYHIVVISNLEYEMKIIDICNIIVILK